MIICQIVLGVQNVRCTLKNIGLNGGYPYKYKLCYSPYKFKYIRSDQTDPKGNASVTARLLFFICGKSQWLREIPVSREKVNVKTILKKGKEKDESAVD